MHTVVETTLFSRQAGKLFTTDEYDHVIELLATDPVVGDEIQGTGGIRKVRVAARGQGKRGGARVIYYYYNERIPVVALTAYAKNRKDDIDVNERKTLVRLVDIFVNDYRSRS